MGICGSKDSKEETKKDHTAINPQGQQTANDKYKDNVRNLLTKKNPSASPAANRQGMNGGPGGPSQNLAANHSLMANHDGFSEQESVFNTERQIQEQLFQIELGERLNQQNAGQTNQNLSLGQLLYRPNPLANLMNALDQPLPQRTIDIYDPATIEQMRNRPLSEQGLAQWQIETIMSTKFDRSRLNTTDKGKLECTVCLVGFKDGDVLKTLQCLHCYHGKCIDDWLSKRSTCPTCNFNMRSIDFDQLMD
jgi:Ring finger domain